MNTVSISLTARNAQGKLVGALYGLTDYAYWLYITDLGVDRDYTHQGIGRRLMQTAHQLAGGEKYIAVYLIANKNAVPFYEKCGMKKADDVMQYGDMVVVSYEEYQRIQHELSVVAQLREAEWEARSTKTRFTHSEVMDSLRDRVRKAALKNDV